jgi:hypothetical protein
MIELLRCAGGCTSRNRARSRTCPPLLTSFCATSPTVVTPLMSPFTPLLTPLHTHCLSLSIGHCQYRRNGREAERSNRSNERKGFSARDHFRFGDHVNLPD